MGINGTVPSSQSGPKGKALLISLVCGGPECGSHHIHILLSYNFCQILNSHLELQQYMGSLPCVPHRSHLLLASPGSVESLDAFLGTYAIKKQKKTNRSPTNLL